jgi:SAM-dependent methyltransferase
MAGPREDPTRAHHRLDRLPVRRRFDEVECTISHLLRRPHPALGGRSYGQALLQGASRLGLGPGRSGVVELGGGAGHVAQAALGANPGARDAGPFSEARWISLELSPRLSQAQRARVGSSPRWAGLRADAVALPLRARSLDGLLLANEVIADLPVVDGRNEGALQLVREIARVLAPGGSALLTEFGGDFAPGPVNLYAAGGAGEHTEWSIDFRALRAEASAQGLEVAELPLHELLQADLSVRLASYTDLWRLRRLTHEEVFAAPAEEIRARHPWLSRLLLLELPELGSPRWPDATAPAGFAQLFRALVLRRR